MYYKVVVNSEIRLEREGKGTFDEGVEHDVHYDEYHHAGKFYGNALRGRAGLHLNYSRLIIYKG